MIKKLEFENAPWWKTQLLTIGNEKQPLVIIDNFHPVPHNLITHAKQMSFVANTPYYPGIRAPVPKAYFTPLIQPLSQLLIDIFNYDHGVALQECFYSLVTTLGEDLNMVQRLPHVDGGDDGKVALLHYLCESDKGGTAFYRQIRTGFESVPNSRFADYNSAVHADHERLGPPAAQYFEHTNARFEKIEEVEAKLNRAILYFGSNLHSVLPGDPNKLSPLPDKGRLTVNTFFNPI